MRIIIIITGLLLNALIANGTTAVRAYEDDGLDITSLTTADGLPDNSIRYMHIDSRGFLWIGTLNGLSRYDGYTFLNFKPDRNLPSVAGNRIKDFFESKAGKMWISIAPNMVSCLNLQKGTFEDILGDGTYKAPYNHVAEYDNSIYLWNKSEAVRVDNKDGKNKITKLNQAQSDSIIKMISRSQMPNGVQRREGEKIIVDNLGDLWYYYSDDGRIRYANAQTGIEHSFTLMDQAMVHSLINLRYSIVNLGDGRVWIGTNGNGIYELDIKEGNVLRHLLKSNTGGRLKSDVILSMTSDGNGGLWVGCEYAGLHHILPTYCLYSQVIPFSGKMVADNHIRMLAQSKDGDLYVSNSSGQLALLDSKTYAVKKMMKYNGNVSCMTYDKQGRLWTGIREGGLAVENNIFTPQNSQLSIPTVFSLLCDKKGRIWTGTLGGGLYLWLGDNRFRQFFNTTYGYKRVRALCEDLNGFIWAGTSEGLLIFHPDSLIADSTAYHAYNWSNGALESNEVRCVITDGKNMFIAETGAGLAYCELTGDYNKLTFKHKGTADAIASPMVMAMALGSHSTVWLSTEQGISCFGMNTESMVSNYQQSQDMLQNVYTEDCVLALNDGRILFGSLNGITEVKPLGFPKLNKKPKVVFTTLTVNNGDPAQYSVSLPYIDKVILNHDQNNLRFTFSVMENQIDRYEYTYMLEGFDKKWSIAGPGNTADYKRLPSGNYKLLVRARSADGQMGETSVLNVRIKQPWWNTWIAWTIYTLLALGLLALLITYLRRLNTLRNKVKLEREMSEYKDSFFMNVSHEFRTPITLILASVEKLAENSQQNDGTGRTVKMMERNAHRLLALVNQFLEVKKIESGKMLKKIDKCNVSSLASKIIASYDDLAQNKNIQLSIDDNCKGITLLTDEDKLEKIITNLISNAVKYTHDGGTVNLALDYDGMELKGKVTDTGIGVPENKRAFIFERFGTLDEEKGGIGIGLYYTKELAETLGGTVEYEPNPAGGSIFSFHVQAEQTEASEDKQEIANAAPATPLNEYNIMVIDDEDDMRAFLEESLSKYFNVEAFADGKSGLEYANANDIDLIVCDVMMEGMDGFEVVRSLRANFNTCHIPVILLTALDAYDSRLEGVESGADDYITKPFSSKFLLTRITKLIEQRETLKEKFSRDITRTKPLISKSDQDKEFIDKLQEIINRELDNDEFSVDDFAKEMGLGRTVFYKKVKGVTGYSPKEYLRIVRMKKAALLLLTPGVTVAEVAYTVGIGDPFYFSKLFKAQFGIPPSEYQKNNQEQ